MKAHFITLFQKMANLPYFLKVACGSFKNISKLVENPWGDPTIVKIFRDESELMADEGKSSILIFNCP